VIEVRVFVVASGANHGPVTENDLVSLNTLLVKSDLELKEKKPRF
jgi:hypothetical protein